MATAEVWFAEAARIYSNTIDQSPADYLLYYKQECSAELWNTYMEGVILTPFILSVYLCPVTFRTMFRTMFRAPSAISRTLPSPSQPYTRCAN